MAVVLALRLPPLGMSVISEVDNDGKVIQMDARMLRGEAVEGMRRMREEEGLTLFGDELPEEDEDEYLVRMEQPGQWMNGPALSALGIRHKIKAYCCYIDSKLKDRDQLVLVDCTLGREGSVAIVLCWSGQHYEPLGRWDPDARRYTYRFNSDQVEQLVRTEARECIEAWFNIRKPGADQVIEGVSDIKMLGKLNAKRKRLQIDYFVLREQQAITAEVVNNKIAELEMLEQGEDWSTISQQLKKALSGRGSVGAAKKRVCDGLWVMEDQNVLSIDADGWDRIRSEDRKVVEDFRKEHIWRRMLLCAKIREKKPEWFSTASAKA
jgi:hypothetical protein